MIDEAAVTGFLDAHDLGRGPLRWSRLGDGHSNVTFLLERGDRTLVLRRPPRPPLPPSAHDMLRESAIVARLHSAGARVPRVLAVCADDSLLGVPFYVMELAEGEPIDAALPPPIDTAVDRARLGCDVVDALVEIHAIDPVASDLISFGRPDGYLERQVRRFLGLWEINRTRDLPTVGEVGAWLGAHLPASGPATVVHGDYRVGNLLASVDRPARVTAVLDWELATIGDPLADLGYLLATYQEAGDAVGEGITRLSPVTRLEGFPSRQELAFAYATASGRAVGALHWYECLAHWKSAIFCENMYQRFLAGDRDDDFARSMEAGVPAKLAMAAAAAARHGGAE